MDPEANLYEYKVVFVIVSYPAGPQLMPLPGTEGWDMIGFYDGYALIRRLREDVI